MKLLRRSSSAPKRFRRQVRHHAGSSLIAILFILGMVASGPMAGYLTAGSFARASSDQTYARSLSEAFRQASEKALDSVVTIRSQPKSVSRDELRWPRGDRYGGDPLEEFFGGRFGRRFSPGAARRRGSAPRPSSFTPRRSAHSRPPSCSS